MAPQQVTKPSSTLTSVLQKVSSVQKTFFPEKLLPRSFYVRNLCPWSCCPWSYCVNCSFCSGSFCPWSCCTYCSFCPYCVLTWELSVHEAIVQTVVSVCEAVVHAVTFVHWAFVHKATASFTHKAVFKVSSFQHHQFILPLSHHSNYDKV